MKSPFKFLDAYTKEDRDIFFGREKEIEELYHRIFDSRILLVYGESGTGKSSLIQCGLANKFRDSDWLPIMIRRGDNLPDSIARAVKAAATTPIDYELLTTAMFKKAIRSLYIDYYKPIFFIFDQFEELFIFGSKEEKQSLVHLVQALVDSDIECRFIFIMREEYIANVTEFEKNVHGFLSNRVRIERMPHENAVMAIKGPCSVYDIDLEEGFPQKLLNKLSPESPDIELTYLQVFLDKIYNLALKKKEKEKSTLRFSLDLLEKTGDVSDLLGSFLEEQISLMPDQEAALAVLKSFVSVKGTKRQLTLQEVKDNAYTLGKSIEEPLLVEMIQAFVHLRILRDKDQSGRYELRHDALASRIFEKISNIEKEILEIRQFVENAYYNWQKRDVLLTEDDLKYIGPYRSRLYLSEELSLFSEKSEKALEGKRRRRRQLAITIPTVIIIVLSTFTGWALIEKKKSDRNYIKARANYYRITAKELAAKDPVAGLRLAQYAFSLDSTEESRRTMYDIYRDYNFYKTLTRLKSYICWGAKFSPDGKSIILGSTDYALKLIDLKGRTIREFDCKGRTYFDSFTGVPSLASGASGGIMSADFSPDGNNIAVSTADRVVYLFDKNGNRVGNPFKGHNRAIWSLCFSKDGSKILTGSADSTAILWDMLGNIIKRYRLIGSRIYNASISPDGSMVFVGGVQDGDSLETSILYNTNGTKIRDITGHTAGVLRSPFSSDNKNILTGSSDGTAVLWDINGNRIKEFIGHRNHVPIAEFSPDGGTILTGSADNTLRLWNLNGSLIQELTGCFGGAFSPDGNQILGWSEDFSVKLWNIGDRKRPLFRMNDNWVRNASFSNNKNLILTRGILNNEVLKDLDGNTIWESHERMNHSDISLSPDNEKLLLRSGNGQSLKICNLKSKAERVIIDTTGITSAVFMADGNILARFGSGSIKIDTGGKNCRHSVIFRL